jgi:ATP-dependent Lhr-like helicase
MTQPGGFYTLHPVVQHHIANTLGWGWLRPLQSESIGPVLGGSDCLLLAPTAGGKTEAALFPLLTRMAEEAWTGTSVLYVCPLRALLNNLEPRIASYAGWLGRTAAVRHGDTTAGARKRQVFDRPDILLTTPESLESMLVSTLADPRQLFADVRAIVVDEVHAFAGDDRGWHLLGVLERISKLAGHPLQRIGLSATVGNAQELLTWLQGSNRISEIPSSVIAPDGGSAAVPQMQLDFVGSDLNAAKVIAALYRGEKRLVFADSRRTVEKVSLGLRDLEVETFVSHSSLSVDARRQAETAFSQARNCVIVSTSTLELGIDVGDLDRVVQIGAPRTVASVLQRLGRTGRRPGTLRNMLFLSTDDAQFLRACGLLLLWSEGYVEPVTPPADSFARGSTTTLGADTPGTANREPYLARVVLRA